MTEDRDQLIEEGLPVLELVARRIERKLGGRIAIDDLRAMGRVALLDIADTYDPTRAQFVPYCALRLKWAIYDGVRKETHGRVIAARAAALKASERYGEACREPVEDPGGMPPTAEEFQARLAKLLEGHAAALATGLVTAMPDLDHIEDREASPEECVSRAEFARNLKQRISELPEREQALVERHYYGDEQFESIARDLGISKSWASRLHAQAMQRLATSLAESGPTGRPRARRDGNR